MEENKRFDEKTGKLQILSSPGDLPPIWITVDDTEKHELCPKCIPHGKCMGFNGGSEERLKRKMEERKEFLEEVFSNLEENLKIENQFQKGFSK